MLKSNKETITLQIEGYFKKGDDFGHLLKEFSVPKALEMWSENLFHMAKSLKKASELLKDQPVIAEGNTHYAGIYDINRKIAEELLKTGYFYEDAFYDEDEDEDEESYEDEVTL